MPRHKLIFISSVQKELSHERRAVKDFVQGDALLGHIWANWAKNFLGRPKGLMWNPVINPSNASFLAIKGPKGSPEDSCASGFQLCHKCAKVEEMTKTAHIIEE